MPLDEPASHGTDLPAPPPGVGMLARAARPAGRCRT